MLKDDARERATERLEQLIDPDWVSESRAVQQALWDGQPFTRLPCIVSVRILDTANPRLAVLAKENDGPLRRGAAGAERRRAVSPRRCQICGIRMTGGTG